MSMVTEILFDIPSTAHMLGGCPMAGAPAQGVVDARHRVFGYKNMYVCDGSVIAANLGVNPSLTICALTERAMSFIPAAGETEWNDAAESTQLCAQDQSYAQRGIRERGSIWVEILQLRHARNRAGLKKTVSFGQNAVCLPAGPADQPTCVEYT